MSELTYFTLGRTGLCLAWASAILLLVGAFGSQLSPGRMWLRRYEMRLKVQLDFLRLRRSPRQVWIGQLGGCALACVSGAALHQWPLLGLSVIVCILPSLWLERLVNTRVSSIESQTDTWLGALANALRASPSLGDAIASTIVVTGQPLSSELETLMKDYELGTPLDEALDNLGQRCRSPVMDACLQALRVARNTGGNLSDTLETAAAALRELARLEGVVRTKTAEGKMQSGVIGFIPLPLICGINAMDPGFLAPLWTTFSGNLVVAMAAVLWLAAVLLARKIVAVDV